MNKADSRLRFKENANEYTEWIDELCHQVVYQDEIFLTTKETEEIIEFLKNHVAMLEQALVHNKRKS